MPDDSADNLMDKAKDFVKNNVSSAWLFPGCSCLLIILFLLISVGAFAATFSKHQGEESALSGGTGSCATTLTYEEGGKTYRIPESESSGKFGQEDHLVTKDDPTRAPTAEWWVGRIPHSKKGIQDHLRITNFSSNCPSSSSYCDPNKQEWTPGEPTIGKGGYRVPLGEAPTAIEPWGMNMRWTDTPPVGTKVIITEKTGKSVVAAAGMEWGPGGHDLIGGAQNEVLANLGIGHGDEVTLGFAEDQTLPYGPITCTGGGGSVGGGQCGQAIIQQAIKYQGIGRDHCGPNTIGPSGVTGVDCSGFVSRVYRDLGLAPKNWCFRTAQLRSRDRYITNVLTEINALEIQPGDLVSSGTSDRDGHVVIYVSGNVNPGGKFQIWHSGNPPGRVGYITNRRARLNQQYWRAKQCFVK